MKTNTATAAVARPTVRAIGLTDVGGFCVHHENNYSSRSYVTTPAGEIVAGPFFSRSEAYRVHTQLAAGDLAPFPSW